MDELLKKEETMWSKRSRASWLRDGDKNTAFFHRKASRRRKRNSIQRIKNETGCWVREEEGIKEVVRDYFMKLFHSSSPTKIEEVTSVVTERITDQMNESLAKEYSKEEVMEALQRMHPTKAPGPDGMPVLFYHKFWHLISPDVLDIVLGVLNKQMNPKAINHTHICLIPKIL